MNDLDYSKQPFFIKKRLDVIFIHIPKTGGTSVANHLKFNPPVKGKIKKHNPSKVIRSVLPQDIWNDAYKFTIIRNPWDRLASLYFYRKREGRLRKASLNDSFSEWVIFKLKDNKKLTNKKRLAAFAPMQDWLEDQSGNLNYNRILRFENIQEDFKLLCKDIRIKPFKLPKVNANPNKVNYHSLYTDEANKFMHMYYAKDIEQFNYSFDSNA